MASQEQLSERSKGLPRGAILGVMEAELPYPKRAHFVDGKVVYEYLIPVGEKAKVLRDLYPFVGVPSLQEKRYDLHEGKVFRVVDFQVVRERDHKLAGESVLFQ